MKKYFPWKFLIFFTISCLAFQLLETPAAYAQSVKTNRISLSFQNIPLGKAIKQLAQVSNLAFTYNEEELNHHMVTASFSSETIENVLNKLLSGLKYRYHKENGKIIIYAATDPNGQAQVQASQTLKIKGTVRDRSGGSLPGVSIVVQNHRTANTSSASDGSFALTIDAPSATLTFTMVGFEMQQIVVDQSGDQEVIMKPSSSDLEEVVVVGYGTMLKKDITGAVSSVDRTVLKQKAVTSVTDFLRGTVAGVTASANSTAAGGASLQIRGPNSLMANTAPLVVLDGSIFYGNMNDIDPNIIESIDILKDASSTAIYGARGSAGVIMISTKKGSGDRNKDGADYPTVTFTSRFGLAQIDNMEEVYSPEGYIHVREDYFKTLNFYTPAAAKKPEGYYNNPEQLPQGVTKEQWAAFDPAFSGDYTSTWLNRLQLQPIEIENYLAGKTIDWLDLILRTGKRQDYDIAISGNSQRTNYLFSAGYVNNSGIRVGDEYKNFRTRINLESELSKWLSLGINGQFANRSNDQTIANMDYAVSASPYGNMWDENGEMEWYPHNDMLARNPFTYTYNRSSMDKSQTMLATMFAKVKLPFDITYQVNWLNRLGWSKAYSFDPDKIRGVKAGGVASREDGSSYEWMVDNILKWNKTFGVHHFDATVVANVEKLTSWTSTQGNDGFLPNGNLTYHGTEAGVNPTVGSNDYIQTGTAFLSRLNYSLKGRYILTGSLRRDGFSAFGQEHPYGVFPSVAGAWLISEEKFFNNSIIDNLKLRASWGMNGNREFGRYAALATMYITQNVINGESVTGIWNNTLANKSLKWEATKATNIGLDFALLNNRLSGSLEYYVSKTNDLLLTRSLPDITGYESIAANLGELQNTGFEVTLNTINLSRNKFKWNSTLLISHNKNRINHLYGEMVDVRDSEGKVTGQKESDDVTNGWYIGHGIDEIYGYKFDGIWQIGEEEAAAAYGKRPGDARLLDVNGDHVIDSNHDQVWLGRKAPDFTVSLRNDFDILNHFNVSFLFTGAFGYYGAYNNAQNGSDRFYNRLNNYVNDYWTPEHPSNEYAALGSNSSTPSFTIYRKRDFIRLQDVALSYSVPGKTTNKIGLKGLRFSFNMDNAFTISNWPFFDPETQGTLPRIYTLGISATL